MKMKMITAVLGSFVVFGIASAIASPQVDPEVRSQLAQLRAATARFHDIRVAELEGYTNSGIPCTEGMGYHWRKASLIGTAIADAPPVLVYYPRADGFLELVAVEWVSPFKNTPPPPQELFGQLFHLPTWPGGPTDRYVLHAWVWLDNGDGMFDDTNPKLTCPSTSSSTSSTAQHASCGE
jgi:hypothetical protein